jgi:hypothetical protein
MQDYRVKGIAPDMTEQSFLAVLGAAQSPVSDFEARAVYKVCVLRQCSPAFLLALFNHESGMGKNGWAVTTHSWGNTRPPAYGVPYNEVISQDKPDRGRYLSIYDDWKDGGISTVLRLFQHAPYTSKYTVREIIPIWAPSTDGNDTERYIASVLADIARFAAVVPPDGQKGPNMALADRVDILPPGSNRPQTKLRGFHAVVIHETDNEAPGANARMHRRWLEQSRPDASFHFCVDADESLQILPDDEVCWAIGDGADQADDESFYTVSIEICVNDKARYPQACRRAAKVAAAVLHKKGTPPSSATVRQHGSYWSARNPSVHKNCPLHLRNNDWGVTWTGFLSMVQEEYEAGAVVNRAPIPFQHAPGFSGPPLIDTMNWGKDTAGIIVERHTKVYNDQTGKWYWLTWDDHNGIQIEDVTGKAG